MDDAYKSNTQIKKFGLYGLLKNLKFFEPFLLLFFLENNLNFVEIGFLYSIREAIIYVFEIPSGVFADRFGKKNELVLCFVLYIMSFVTFFLASNFILMATAMIFFGFGEALRSGTHKAMIMEYLDINGIKQKKSKIYGYTRSFSNLGSAVSSIVGIVLILFTPTIRYLFLFAIIPYLIDLLLILSYPEYLNKKQEVTFNFGKFLLENIKSIGYVFNNKQLANYIIESSGFNAVFKTIKDYIQPLILGVGIVIVFTQKDIDTNAKIYLGTIYAIAQLISVFVSKNAYRLEKSFNAKFILRVIWFMTALTLILMGIYSDVIYVIIGSFIMLYVYLNVRKPFMVEKIGDETENDKRASVLSIESQITSLFIIVFAPILGYISEIYSIGLMLIILGVFLGVVGVLKMIFLNQKKT